MDDQLLVLLVKLVEALDTASQPAPAISITLNVGGEVISGTLVSRYRYMQQFKEGRFHDLIAKAIGLGKMEGPKLAEDSLDYLHLALSKATVEGEVWRIRLSSIDGFTLGPLPGPSA